MISQLFYRDSKMFNLEVEKIIEYVKQNNCQRILLQLPDGLKLKSGELVDVIEKEANIEVLIWFGSCYGGCDVPNVESLGVDLVVSFGHNSFKKEMKW